jgi:hypothetical protein
MFRPCDAAVSVHTVRVDTITLGDVSITRVCEQPTVAMPAHFPAGGSSRHRRAGTVEVRREGGRYTIKAWASCQ